MYYVLPVGTIELPWPCECYLVTVIFHRIQDPIIPLQALWLWCSETRPVIIWAWLSDTSQTRAPSRRTPTPHKHGHPRDGRQDAPVCVINELPSWAALDLFNEIASNLLQTRINISELDCYECDMLYRRRVECYLWSDSGFHITMFIRRWRGSWGWLLS